MNTFFKKLTITGCYFFLVLCALEIPIQWNYETQITDAGDWHCLDSIDAEILIIGNSRVESGFDASQIEMSTGLSTYCLVQTGWQSKLLRKKLENYLKTNQSPQFIAVQSDPLHLSTRTDWYAKPSFLKFLFLDREELYHTMSSYKGFHWYDFYIPFIRYMGLPGRYVRDAFNLPFKMHRIKGYRPNNGHRRNEPLPIDSLIMKNNDIEFLSSFYNQVPNAEPIAVFPLVTRELYPRIIGIDDLEAYCTRSDVHLLNLNCIVDQKPDSIFSNHTHTNIWGSAIQTDIFSDFINALQQP